MPDEFSLRDLIAFVGEEVREPMRTLTNGLTDLSRSPEVTLLRQALKAAQTVGGAANLLPPALRSVAPRREVDEALAQLSELADRLRREGVDPAVGIANLVGDCLDGLAVLVATEAVPLPVELEELRLALARARRPEIRLDLALPAEGARPALAGRMVRALVEDAADLAETPAALSELERASAEAVAGALERTRAHDPAQSVEVHARLRGDLLTVEVVDRGAGEAQGETGADGRTYPVAAGWDVELVRRAMDQVAYERGEKGGVLRLRKELRSWQWRRSRS